MKFLYTKLSNRCYYLYIMLKGRSNTVTKIKKFCSLLLLLSLIISPNLFYFSSSLALADETTPDSAVVENSPAENIPPEQITDPSSVETPPAETTETPAPSPTVSSDENSTNPTENISPDAGNVPSDSTTPENVPPEESPTVPAPVVSVAPTIPPTEISTETAELTLPEIYLPRLSSATKIERIKIPWKCQ